MAKDVRDQVRRAVGGSEQTPKPPTVSLCVAVYAPQHGKQGVPTSDTISKSGLAVVLLQLGISAIPMKSHDWLPLVITLLGNVLAWMPLATLPWTDEKWTCRRNADAPFIITKGNGHQHAIVILGNGHGLDLEDLATAHQPVGQPAKVTVVIIAAMWILLLIASTSVGSSSSALWLLAVGALGMLQNIVVASWRRASGVNGIHLDYQHCFLETSVFDTLIEVERRHHNVGRSLVSVFFPNGISVDQEERFRSIEGRSGQTAAIQDQRRPRLDAAMGHGAHDVELLPLLPTSQ
jgi:hypothetical protein